MEHSLSLLFAWHLSEQQITDVLPLKKGHLNILAVINLGQ